jgi:hypothetical protein
MVPGNSTSYGERPETGSAFFVFCSCQSGFALFAKVNTGLLESVDQRGGEAIIEYDECRRIAKRFVSRPSQH